MKKALLSSLVISGLFFFGCSNQPSASNSTPVAATKSTTPSSAGEEVVMEEVGIKYTIPSGWKKEPEGNLSGDNGNVAVFFIVPPDGKGEEVLKNLMGSLEKNLTDVKIDGEANEHEFGGVKSYSANGTGKTKDGQEMNWGVEVMTVKKPLILLEMTAKGSREKNKASLDAFEQSFAAFEAVADKSGATPKATSTHHE